MTKKKDGELKKKYGLITIFFCTFVHLSISIKNDTYISLRCLFGRGRNTHMTMTTTMNCIYVVFGLRALYRLFFYSILVIVTTINSHEVLGFIGGFYEGVSGTTLLHTEHNGFWFISYSGLFVMQGRVNFSL